MKIIGHRGSSFLAPENTLAAFKVAWEEGADGVEFDIQLTKDRRIAVIHDDNTHRTTGRRAKVADSPFYELRKLDAGSWKDPKWRGEPIPDLAEVLAGVPAGKLAMVEIKCGAEILPDLSKVVKAAHLEPDQLMFLCFHRDVLAETLMAIPGFVTVWNHALYRKGLDGAWAPSADKLIEQAQEAGIRGLGIKMCDGVTDRFVDQVHAAGMTLFVWTVDEIEIAKRMKIYGADYLATNKPTLIIPAL